MGNVREAMPSGNFQKLQAAESNRQGNTKEKEEMRNQWLHKDCRGIKQREFDKLCKNACNLTKLCSCCKTALQKIIHQEVITQHLLTKNDEITTNNPVIQKLTQKVESLTDFLQNKLNATIEMKIQNATHKLKPPTSRPPVMTEQERLVETTQLIIAEKEEFPPLTREGHERTTTESEDDAQDKMQNSDEESWMEARPRRRQQQLEAWVR
ncbi:hypothetical protein ANN_24708 [Periplaneta americana]|uniref:Uncharacterized protein n=1 Tax=Periplaneta americana TaxID=6978 RepID=A0ABQ8RZB6_PERAM|nr:hypothetical protein ANN_24708 [Periplaneta americana]